MLDSSNRIKDFTDLIVWRKAHELVIRIYKLVRSFPRYEQHGLADQMRRAAVSVTSNIAVGFGRQGTREKVQFYYLAVGSLTELRNQILVAKDVYNSDARWELERIVEVEKILSGLIKATRSRI